MVRVSVPIDQERAIGTLMEMLAIEGASGREKAVAAAVRERLRAAGVPARAVIDDGAHLKLATPGQVGNLIVRLPGTVRGPALVFMGHMDTVPLAKGARPVRRGRRIVPAGKTALGGDDRTAVACLVTLVETLLKTGEPHPPLAITGMLTAAVTALVIAMSYPSCVPSASMLVSRISPAPNSATRLAHATASSPVGTRPPSM